MVEWLLSTEFLMPFDKATRLGRSRFLCPLPQEKRARYRYSDYVTWPNDERWELIDGVPYNLTLAPTPRHQKVAARFFSRLEAALEGKPCPPFIAPTDVVLSEYDVVQPDILVICDEQKVTRINIRGAPALVVEVASPFYGHEGPP